MTDRDNSPNPAESGTVGFIGLGDMGSRMALRIAAAGLPLIVHDPRAEATAEITRAGGRDAGSAAGVVAASKITGICVVDDTQLMDVLDEVRPELGSGKSLLVHSSVAPSTVRKIDSMVQAAGAAVVDAPVSGSRPAADRGELTVLVGGHDSDIDRVEHVLRTFAKQVLRVGAVGTAQAMKITNNVMLHMNHLIALEALRFAFSQGLSEAAVIEAVNLSSGRSWVTETWGLIDDMMRDHPQAGTPAIFAMMSKELWQSVAVARQDLTPMPLTALGTQVSRAFFEERMRDLGM